MQLSERQQNILEEWRNTDNNIVIGAVAGSGKTSVLMMILELCQHRTLFIAFNKSIQTEIQKKIDERGLKQGKSLTLHSIGFTALRKTNKRIIVNNNKNWSIVNKLNNELKLYRKHKSEEVLKINYALIDLNDASRIIMSDDFDVLKDYLLTIDKTIPSIFNKNSSENILKTYWEKFIEIREMLDSENKIEIDFLDMIYLPVKWNLEIPIYPYYLLIDECQDVNTVQHMLIDKLISQGTISKWVAVGDPKQAIYGFAGANSNSFNMFLTKAPNTVELPLDICYRCSSNIIDKANEVYHNMVAYKTTAGIVAATSTISSIKDNSMVICRNTNPLISLYFELLSLGKNCYINGSEILSNLVKFLKPYKHDTIHSAKIEMGYTLESLEEDKTNYGIAKKRYFEENFNNFIKISNNITFAEDEEKTIEVLLGKLHFLFDNKDNAIMLCTIHKSKGLEADVVYILNENLIPSKFAKSKEQLEQEQNLKYVARTRAKKEMYFLNL